MGRLICYSTKTGTTDLGLEIIRFLESRTISTENFLEAVEKSPNNCNVQEAIDSFFRFIRSKARAKMRGTDQSEMTKDYILSFYESPATHGDDLIRKVLERMDEKTFNKEFSRVRREEAGGM